MIRCGLPSGAVALAEEAAHELPIHRQDADATFSSAMRVSPLPNFLVTREDGTRYYLPCEDMMNGPARRTASSSPRSLRNFTSQSRCISARASGAFFVFSAAS